MNISAEPIAQGHLLREHAKGQGYGDPYTWAAVAVPAEDDPGTAILCGAMTAPKGGRSVFAALAELGYTHVRWERRTSRGVRWTRRIKL